MCGMASVVDERMLTKKFSGPMSGDVVPWERRESWDGSRENSGQRE